MIYTNPVISGFHPDPSICKVGDHYYLVTSSFEYFPGIPIFHSKDLVNWHQIGHVLTRESQLPLKRVREFPASQGIYAPTIRYYNERYYVITTNMTTMKNFYVWAEKPEGPWSEPIIIEDWIGFDPSLYFGQDGTVYLTGAGLPMVEPEGIYQAEIDIETGKLLSDRRLIWKGTGHSSPEGPHLYKINDWYYLMIAEGGTEYGHMVTIARSKNPFGPFESNPNNPILSNRSTDKVIQATGHADLIQDTNGSWWAVFLGIRPIPGTKLHHLGRETNLAPVHWTNEGWPIIGTNGQADLQYNTNLSTNNQSQFRAEKEDFNTENLSPVWNFYRNPASDSWSLTEKPGYLTLYGKACTLNDQDSPTFVGRRQQHFNCEVSSLLEFNPKYEGEEAGLTVFMNENFHYEMARTFKKGKSFIVFRRRVGSIVVEEEIEYSHPTVVFGIEANESNYTFYSQSPNGERVIVGTGETTFLTKEIAGGFTGIFFGMYATGNGMDAKTPAHFDYFIYSPYEEPESYQKKFR